MYDSIRPRALGFGATRHSTPSRLRSWIGLGLGNRELKSEATEQHALTAEPGLGDANPCMRSGVQCNRIGVGIQTLDEDGPSRDDDALSFQIVNESRNDYGMIATVPPLVPGAAVFKWFNPK